MLQSAYAKLVQLNSEYMCRFHNSAIIFTSILRCAVTSFNR